MPTYKQDPKATQGNARLPFMGRAPFKMKGSPFQKYASDAQRKAVHASKAEKSPANMDDLSGDGKITKKDVLIGRGVINKDGSPAMKKDFPEIKKSNEGKFTAWAKRNGFKDAMSAANAVMKDTDKYSASVVKIANYAKNFGK